MAVTDKDMGFVQAVTSLEKLARLSVKIGIQSDAGSYPDGTSVLDVAVWNEFGTAKIPSRPFIRQCFTIHSENAQRLLAHIAQNVMKGANPETELSRVGQWYQDQMKRVLRTHPWQPNSVATIKRKGSSRPLVDTGQLVNAIRYKVDS